MADRRQVKIDIIGDAKSAQGAFSTAGQAADGLGSKLAGVAKIAAGFVVAQGIIKLPGLLLGGADAAVKLEANAKKAALVFGDSLGTVQKWAETSAAGMGLTNKEATTLAASMADLLIPMGFTREAAAGMSTEVLGLSGALAEWSGGQKSAADVATILNKALLGEREELKSLGISITAADVAQRLLEKGQKDLTGAALQQAEAEATLELIFEKSKDAQTAYADSTNDLMSRKARLVAMVNTLKERLQMALLPVLTVVFGVLEGGAGIVTRLVTAFDQDGLLGALRELGTLAGDAATKVAGLASSLADKLLAVDWGGLLASVGGSILDGILAGLQSVADFGLRFGQWIADKIFAVDWPGVLSSAGGLLVDGLFAAFNTARDFGGQFAGWVSDQISGVDWGGAASGAGSTILDGIIAGFGAATDFGGRLVDWLVEAVTDIDYKGFGAAILDGMVAGWEATTDFGERFIDWVVGVFEGVEWKELGGTILDGIITGWKAVTDWGQRAIDWMVGAFESVEWKALGQAILDGVLTGFEAATDWGSRFVAWFEGVIRETNWDAVGQALVDQFNAGIAAADQQETANSLMEALQPLFDRMREDWIVTVDNLRLSWENMRSVVQDMTGYTLPGLDGALAQTAVSVGTVLMLPTVAATEAVRILSGVVEFLSGVLASFMGAVNTFAVPAFNEIVKYGSIVTVFLRGDFSGAWNEITELLSRIWSASGIPGVVSAGMELVKGAITSSLGAIQGVWNSMWDAMLGKVQAIIGAAAGAVSGLINAINGVIGRINSALEFSHTFSAELFGVGFSETVSFNAPDIPFIPNPFGGSSGASALGVGVGIPGIGGGGSTGGGQKPIPGIGGFAGGGPKPSPHPGAIDPTTGLPYGGTLTNTGPSTGRAGGGKGIGAIAAQLMVQGVPADEAVAAATAAVDMPNSPVPRKQGSFQTQSDLRDRDPAAYAALHGGVLLKSGLIGYPARDDDAGGGVFLDGFKVGKFLGWRHRRQAFERRDPVGACS